MAPRRPGRRLARSRGKAVEPEPVSARPLLPAGDVQVGSGPRSGEPGLNAYGLFEGTPVIVFLREPKEKVWGLLISLGAAGLVLRGMDLQSFGEWMRQEARGEEVAFGPSTIFYPMHRVERMERDETVGVVVSFADRFRHEVGRTVNEVMGIG